MDIYATPNPAASPIEKLQVPRKTYAGQPASRWRHLLEKHGVPGPLAEALAHAFQEHSEQVLLDAEANFRALEHWANIHTHDSGGGHGFDFGPPTEEDTVATLIQTSGGDLHIKQINPITWGTVGDASWPAVGWTMGLGCSALSWDGLTLRTISTGGDLFELSANPVGTISTAVAIGVTPNQAGVATRPVTREPYSDNLYVGGTRTSDSARVLRKITPSGGLIWDSVFTDAVQAVAVAYNTGEVFVHLARDASNVHRIYRLDPDSGAQTLVTEITNTSFFYGLDVLWDGALAFWMAGTNTPQGITVADGSISWSGSAPGTSVRLSPDQALLGTGSTAGGELIDAATGADVHVAMQSHAADLIGWESWFPDSSAYLSWQSTTNFAKQPPGGAATGRTHITNNKRYGGFARRKDGDPPGAP